MHRHAHRTRHADPNAPQPKEDTYDISNHYLAWTFTTPTKCILVIAHFGRLINAIVRCIIHAVPKLFHARHGARVTTTKNKYEDYRDNHGPSSWDDRPFAAQVVAHTQLPCAKPSVWIKVATRPHIKVGKKTVITNAE